MHVIITGGAGMLGQRLAAALLKRGQLSHAAGQESAISRLTLFDRAAPPTLPADFRLEFMSGDLTRPDTLAALVSGEVDLIFHLAAVVSGEAEQNFDLGMRVNVAATQALLEACRRLNTRPRLIFASSVAVYGGDLPEVIQDDTRLTPQSSYGAHKAIGELLVSDYSRKGFIDGRAIRLPTIVVRPGRPNQATSTFASSIIREPLQGQRATCPVSPDTRLWIMSPRQAIHNFIHAAALPEAAWGSDRAIALPGLSVSVREMVDSLRAVAGDSAVKRIDWQPDPFIQKIVGSWPSQFNPRRAEALGFQADRSILEIIEFFVADELNGQQT